MRDRLSDQMEVTNKEAVADVLVTSWPAIAQRMALLVLVMLLFGLRTSPMLAVYAMGTVLALGLPFFTRSIVLDTHGFRLIRLMPFIPPKVVAWSDVSLFDVSQTRGMMYVDYWRNGKRAHWWYPAGWPARRSITPTLAWNPRDRPLTAPELCLLLKDYQRRKHRNKAQAGHQGCGM
jgi:hypothetical protein